MLANWSGCGAVAEMPMSDRGDEKTACWTLASAGLITSLKLSCLITSDPVTHFCAPTYGSYACSPVSRTKTTSFDAGACPAC